MTVCLTPDILEVRSIWTNEQRWSRCQLKLDFQLRRQVEAGGAFRVRLGDPMFRRQQQRRFCLLLESTNDVTGTIPTQVRVASPDADVRSIGEIKKHKFSAEATQLLLVTWFFAHGAVRTSVRTLLSQRVQKEQRHPDPTSTSVHVVQVDTSLGRCRQHVFQQRLCPWLKLPVPRNCSPRSRLVSPGSSQAAVNGKALALRSEHTKSCVKRGTLQWALPRPLARPTS